MMKDRTTRSRTSSLARIPVPLRAAVFALIISPLFLASVPAFGCSMEFRVTGGEKEGYAPGDTVTVSLTLMLTHGNCLVEPADTEFHATGLEILGATAWKRIRERPVILAKKLSVVSKGDGSDGEVALRAVRLCERQGGDLKAIFVPEKKKIRE